MAVETKLMTAEELLRMPDDGYRHELVNGELRTMSPAGARHGWIAARILLHLGNYVVQKKLGKVYAAETGFILARSPDTVRAPDVPFVRKERDLDERGYFPGPPDLAVEVVSPSDRFSEVEEKVRDYLRAGTLLVIVVDPETQVAWTHTPAHVTRLTIDDALEGAEVVPGWRLPLREVFV